MGGKATGAEGFPRAPLLTEARRFVPVVPGEQGSIPYIPPCSLYFYLTKIFFPSSERRFLTWVFIVVFEAENVSAAMQVEYLFPRFPLRLSSQCVVNVESFTGSPRRFFAPVFRGNFGPKDEAGTRRPCSMSIFPCETPRITRSTTGTIEDTAPSEIGPFLGLSRSR